MNEKNKLLKKLLLTILITLALIMIVSCHLNNNNFFNKNNTDNSTSIKSNLVGDAKVKVDDDNNHGSLSNHNTAQDAIRNMR